MAQVPYNPVPSAQPQIRSDQRAGERVSINTSTDMFGANIGAALRQVGAGWEQVGDAVFNQALAYQKLQNETDARNAASQYAEEQATLQAKFDALPQDAAVNALPDHLAASRALRDQYRSSLNTPEAQRMYDGFSFGFMERNVFSSARHAGDEQRKAINAGYEATKQMTLQQVPSVASNDPAFDQIMQTHLDAVAAQTKFNAGLDQDSPDSDNDPRVQAAVTTERGKIIAERVRAAAALHADAADKMADRYQKELGPLYEPLKDYIEQKGSAVAASNIADRWAGRTDLSVEERANGAAEQAREDHPTNERLPQIVKQQTKNRIYLDEQLIQRDKLNAQHDLGTLLIQRPDITDSQALLATPEGDAIVRKMQAQGQLPTGGKALEYLDDVIFKSNQKHYGTVFQVNYQNLHAMAETNTPQFLNTDLNTVPLSPQDRPKLQALQAKKMQDPRQDQRVNQAFSLLKKAYGPMLDQMGINPKDRNDFNSAYNTFLGGLQEALAVHLQDKGKPASEEDIKGPIWDQLSAKATEGFWSHTWWPGFKFKDFHQVPMSQVPQGFIDEVQGEATKRGVDPYSGPELRRIYNIKLYNDFFKGAKSDTGSSSGRPEVPTSR